MVNLDAISSGLLQVEAARTQSRRFLSRIWMKLACIAFEMDILWENESSGGLMSVQWASGGHRIQSEATSRYDTGAPQQRGRFLLP